MRSIVLCALLPVVLLAQDSLVLFDFEQGPELSGVAQRSVRASYESVGGGRSLRIASTTREDWPGLTLLPQAGKWDGSAFAAIEMDVTNLGTNPLQVCLRVDNPGADGVKNCVTGRIDLKSGESGVLRQELSRRRVVQPPIEFIGMRGNPFGAADGPRTIDPANISALLVFVAKPTEEHQFRVDNIRLTGTYQPPAAEGAEWTRETFLPFIDTFGQYIHKDWPGKTHSLAELHARRDAEAAELASRPGPEDWNAYGGWTGGPQLEATGFFRVQTHAGKWWLVDPEGRLFFSHGVDCVRAGDMTPLDERDGWFRDLPTGPEYERFYGQAWHVVNGHYKGQRPRCFDFTPANILRKYEVEDWFGAFAETTHRRLRAWGVNTIANWSDSRIYRMQRTPYTATVHFGGKVLAGSQGYWGQFRDVFDPDFKTQLQAAMQRQTECASDPWCIGFFVDNELSWGNETSLAEATLASPANQVAKEVFLADLKAKYGDIARLNEAWGTEHVSWNTLLASTTPPDRTRAREDLVAFYRKTAETYFRTIREAVKEVAPNHLYLGCRFAWVNDVVAKVAAEQCDVVSYNLYRDDVSGFRFPGGQEVPLIIGEFHFGALDRGMFHTGLRPTKDQNERAARYESYVRGVLRHPQFVGCHWFKYMDQPTTGRALDGENYQIGFVDIADTPYPETIAAVRKVGYDMYRYRLSSGR
jgi:hypothetical protein